MSQSLQIVRDYVTISAQDKHTDQWNRNRHLQSTDFQQLCENNSKEKYYFFNKQYRHANNEVGLLCRTGLTAEAWDDETLHIPRKDLFSGLALGQLQGIELSALGLSCLNKVSVYTQGSGPLQYQCL